VNDDELTEFLDWHLTEAPPADCGCDDDEMAEWQARYKLIGHMAYVEHVRDKLKEMKW